MPRFLVLFLVAAAGTVVYFLLRHKSTVNPPTPPMYACVNQKCVTSPSGTFSTPDCDQKCAPPPPGSRYSCVSNACQVDPKGPFVSLAACQQQCIAPPTLYYYCSDPTTQQCSTSTTPVACSPAHPEYCLSEGDCLTYCQAPAQQFWGCQYVVPNDATSARTGACIQYDNAELGTYTSEAACNASGTCMLPQSFACSNLPQGLTCVNCNSGPGLPCQYGPETPPSLEAWNACQSACVPQQKYACSAGTCSVSPSGTFSTLAECQAACPAPVTTYACVSNECQLTAGGPYATLAECQAACPAPATKYACVNNVCQTSATGAYSTLAECQAACQAPGTKYACVNNACQTSATGAYGTLAECQAACPPPATKYACVNNACQTSATGAYGTLAECQAACPPPVTTYACVNGTCQLSATGTFPTLPACQANCAPVCSPPCNASLCEVCVDGRCVDSCASNQSTICPDGSQCPVAGTACLGKWCPGSGPGDWTACPASGSCSDGKACVDVPCQNLNCGTCNTSTGTCEMDPTLCLVGKTCVCPEGKQYPSSECYSKYEPACPTGSNQPSLPFYLCPQYQPTDRNFFCPAQNFMAGTGGLCADNTACVTCDAPSVQPTGLGCCACCPNDICQPMNLRSNDNASRVDSAWL